MSDNGRRPMANRWTRVDNPGFWKAYHRAEDRRKANPAQLTDDDVEATRFIDEDTADAAVAARTKAMELHAQAWAVAQDRYTENPAALTAADLQVLETGGGAVMGARARDARTKALTLNTKAATAAPEFEEDTFLAKHGHKPVDYRFIFETLVPLVKELKDGILKKVKDGHDAQEQLTARASELEKQLSDVKAEVMEKDTRITALETAHKSFMRWGDDYQPGKSYSQGSYVRHAHAFWIALRDTDRKPGLENSEISGWRLVQKNDRPRSTGYVS